MYQFNDIQLLSSSSHVSHPPCNPRTTLTHLPKHIMAHSFLSDPSARLVNGQSLLSVNHSQLDAIIAAIKESVNLNNPQAHVI